MRHLAVFMLILIAAAPATRPTTRPASRAATKPISTRKPPPAFPRTHDPLIDEAVGKLLARQSHCVQPAGANMPVAPKRICFVGVENRIGLQART